MATNLAPNISDTRERDLLDTAAAGPAAIRGSLLRVGGYVSGMLLSVLSVSLLIRHLGITDYGRYITVISLVTIVQGITDVGLGQIGVREYATREVADRERLMRNLLGVRIAVTTVGVAIAAGFAAIAGYGGTLIVGTVLAGVGMVLTVVQGTFGVPLAARLRLGWITAIDLLRQVLTTAGIVALVLAGSQLLAFLAIPVPVSIVVLIATAVLVRGSMPMRPSFQRAEWAMLFRAILPFAAAVAIGTIYLRVTVILMSLLASGVQTGYYATSYRVVEILIALPGLTVGSTLPVLARAARDDHERLGYVLERLFEVTLIVGALLALALVMGAPFAIEVLAGGKAGPSVEVLQIQAFVILTQFVGTGWQYGLLSLHRHRALLAIAGATLALSVGLTLILVPLWGARGAALALSAGELVGTVGSFAVLIRSDPRLVPSRRVPVRVGVAIAAGLVVLVVPGLTSLTRALIASSLYLVVLFALRAIPDELMQAVLKRPQVPRA